MNDDSPTDLEAASQPSTMIEGMDLLSERIPVAPETDDEDAVVSDIPSRPRSSEGREEGLVLIVDASQTRREQLTRVLGRSYRVATSVHGHEALEIARQIQPDLVLADLKIPGMTGFELCRALKSDAGAIGRTPVILLSKKDDLGQRIEALDLGADDYLIKPVHVEELRKRVRNLVRVRRQERELLQALRALEERDAIITQDLMQARELQQSVLPASPAHWAYGIEATYQPADLVGGDLYDFHQLPSGALRVFLADAPGHGVRASLLTMSIKAEYEVAKREAATPDQVLAILNRRFVNAYANVGLHFTALCVDFDPRQELVTWASAAHPPPILLRSGRASELASGGTFVGVSDTAEFALREEPFGDGDALYVYTDGASEQPNARGESFGEARLMQVIEEARHRGRTVGSLLAHHLALFAGLVPPYDDVTLIGVRSSASETHAVYVPPHPERA